MKELMIKMLLLNNMNFMLSRTSELIVYEPFIVFNLDFLGYLELTSCSICLKSHFT